MHLWCIVHKGLKSPFNGPPPSPPPSPSRAVIYFSLPLPHIPAHPLTCTYTLWHLSPSDPSLLPPTSHLPPPPHPPPPFFFITFLFFPFLFTLFYLHPPHPPLFSPPHFASSLPALSCPFLPPPLLTGFNLISFTSEMKTQSAPRWLSHTKWPARVKEEMTESFVSQSIRYTQASTHI